MKQGANSAVRFTSYSTLQQAALGYIKPATGKLNSSVTFGLGAIAGLITVCMYRSSRPHAPDELIVQTQPCLWTTLKHVCSQRAPSRGTETALIA